MSQAAGAGEFQRGGQEGGHRNYAQDARANEIIRDAGGLASRDSDGWSGNQLVARGELKVTNLENFPAPVFPNIS